MKKCYLQPATIHFTLLLANSFEVVSVPMAADPADALREKAAMHGAFGQTTDVKYLK